MTPTRRARIRYSVLQIGDQRFALIPETELRRLAESSSVELEPLLPAAAESMEETLDAPASLGPRLIARRSALGLSQAELARRAGVRVETLNRIERGHTTPDFSTLRKITIAMKDAETRRRQSRKGRNPSMEVNR